jgi:hypothetical protein
MCAPELARSSAQCPASSSSFPLARTREACWAGQDEETWCHRRISRCRTRSTNRTARSVRSVKTILRADLVRVGDVAALGLVEQVQEGMPIEVDPDEVAGDTALVTRVGARVGRTHGINWRFLARDRVAQGLQFGELELADDGLDIRTGKRVVGTADLAFGAVSAIVIVASLFNLQFRLDDELLWSMII